MVYLVSCGSVYWKSLCMPEESLQPQNRHKISVFLPSTMQIQFFPDVTFAGVEKIAWNHWQIPRQLSEIGHFRPELTTTHVENNQLVGSGEHFVALLFTKPIKKNDRDQRVYLQCDLLKGPFHVNHCWIFIAEAWVEDTEYFFGALGSFFPRRYF